MIALAVGLAGYAVWRLAQGVFARHAEGGGKPGIAKRVGYVALGLFYGMTAAFAAGLVLGSVPRRETRRRTPLACSTGRSVGTSSRRSGSASWSPVS